MKLDIGLLKHFKNKKPRRGMPYNLRIGRGNQLIMQANPAPHKPSRAELLWQFKFACLAHWSKRPDPRAFNYAVDVSDDSGWYYRDVIHSAMEGKLLILGQGPRVTTPTVRVRREGAENLDAGTSKALTADVLVWDNNVFWNPQADSSRLTFRTAGVYLVGGSIQYNAVAAGRRDCTIRLNGTTNIEDVYATPAGAIAFAFGNITLWYFNADDYIELMARSSVAGVTAVMRSFWALAITPEAVI